MTHWQFPAPESMGRLQVRLRDYGMIRVGGSVDITLMSECIVLAISSEGNMFNKSYNTTRKCQNALIHRHNAHPTNDPSILHSYQTLHSFLSAQELGAPPP